ncbi:hypothetical protein D1871_23475 [Nakamurella silvestris]|nr:hypothetical protein D1871_23475 [Nakamurella silvestris]
MTYPQVEEVTPPVSENRSSRSRMRRAAWRQHRAWVLGSLGLAGAGAVLLVLVLVFSSSCVQWGEPGASCRTEPGYTLWKLLVAAMTVVPPLVGVILGAVTFGPDVEHRTQVYALTQGVSRMQWWAAKVAVTAAPVFLAVLALGTGTLLYVDSADESVRDWLGRLTTPGFDALGIVPAAHFLVAYAAAATAALMWRTVGGIVAGLLISGLALIGGSFLQPLVVPHDRVLVPVEAWLADETGELAGGIDTAYHSSGFAGSDGKDIDVSSLNCGGLDWSECLIANVTYRAESYVSDSRYLPMMAVIGGINLVVSGAFLGLGALTLRRRDL